MKNFLSLSLVLVALGAAGCNVPPIVLSVTRTASSAQDLQLTLCDPKATDTDFVDSCFDLTSVKVFSSGMTLRNPNDAIVGLYVTDGTNPIRLLLQESGPVAGCFTLDVNTGAGQVAVDVGPFGCPLTYTCTPASACTGFAACPSTDGNTSCTTSN